jgi:MOSC domain-containing protein YiiM
MRSGRVVWIGRRPARREPMQTLEAAELEAGRGLVGDRYSRLGGGRQVTLIEAESLHAIASHLGLRGVAPEALRRNIVTEGINLLALKGRRFRIGATVLEVSGECHPCSRMEEILGGGGYNAVRGLGGVTARVLTGGAIRVGDGIERSDDLAGPLL